MSRKALFLSLFCLSALIPGADFAPPGDSYFTYIDRKWTDVGFFLSPGIWESAVAGSTMGGVWGGLTWRKRVPAGSIGTLIDVGFQRYENGSSNIRQRSLQGGTTDFFLPLVVTVNLFYNGGKYTRQMGNLAPFLGLGIAPIGVQLVDNTSVSNLQGAAVFGQVGVELVPVTPTIGIRLSARVGAETAGNQDAITYLTSLKYDFKLFYSFSVGLVMYLQ